MAQDLLANYKAKHQHPLNRLTHSIGIPMIVVSLPLFFFNWRWAFVAVYCRLDFAVCGTCDRGESTCLFQEPSLSPGGTALGPAPGRVDVWIRQTTSVEVSSFRV
jgi:hypothetical protein